MNFTSKEISLLSDTEFFAVKAHVSPKIRHLLEQIHESFQRELTTHRLLIPDGFDRTPANSSRENTSRISRINTWITHGILQKT